MRLHFLVSLLLFTCVGNAQVERDTTLSRCPVFITDTVSSNNFFIEARPCVLKVYRTKGDLTVVVDQRDQYFTLLFRTRKLRNTKYKIGDDVGVKYSFRSGDQVSYVDVGSGTIEASFDKEKKIWKLKVTGMIANLVERTITYYKVRAELNLKG
jgi:hypothetical protein